MTNAHGVGVSAWAGEEKKRGRGETWERKLDPYRGPP